MTDSVNTSAEPFDDAEEIDPGTPMAQVADSEAAETGPDECEVPQ